MRILSLIVTVTLVGCATQPNASQVTSTRHAANIAAAEKAGYRVVDAVGGQTQFCASAPAVGSHILPLCLTEAKWEQQQLRMWQGNSTSTQEVSGRPSNSGTLGY